MSREVDPAILSFTHLKQYPRQDEALHLLKRVASMVRPLMRARGWTVRSLSEMHPEQANLLGLNVNRGEQILLRLREPYDRTAFLPFEKVVDTMLHELAHIVHGPHDAKFHALWDQLRDELERLIMKGYTGEGFLGKGQRLGGGSGYGVPPHEARRLARVEAERRRQQQQQAVSSRGHRLGGSGPAPGPIPGPATRSAILDSLERRHGADLGCANNNHTEREIQAISQTWTRNGFRTQAEEDAANDAAIAQALWELVQEEQQQQRGLPSPAQPPPIPTSTRPPPPPPMSTRPQLLPPPPRTRPRSPSATDYWSCTACTLHNPLRAPACEACETPRPRPFPAERPRNSASGREVIDLTGESPPRKKARPATAVAVAAAVEAAPPRPAMWTCSFCGNGMESQWWTCSVCGKMKTSS
ncbi:WLM domain-containing protein [Staphylotrichum tortipilum]|uniref:WLM domain-containing protein n=1 Tax=Staphylotrichum tortipilum TaxID=2831512 RepID=A0AAN6MMA0_9PEZI|nr:WLM domain-containing protein [Staphylotrichum longicolle]